MHRTVFGVMQNRYSPPSQWIKGVVDQGLLGDIHLVQVNCYWNRDERYYKAGDWKGTADLDGGTLFTQFSHFIDIMYWLFGDITDIQGQVRRFQPQGPHGLRGQRLGELPLPERRAWAASTTAPPCGTRTWKAA